MVEEEETDMEEEEIDDDFVDAEWNNSGIWYMVVCL